MKTTSPHSTKLFTPLPTREGQGGGSFPFSPNCQGRGSTYCQGRRFFLLPFLLLFFLLFTACTDSRTLRLRGSFDNLRQTDLYIYSPDGGMTRVDTIHVQDGQFSWQTELTEEATFCLVFPNMSEQTILAEPGDRLRLRGDGNQLRSITIKGSRLNEELTDFRLDHLADTPDSLNRAMRAYISAHPDSRISTVLQRQLTRMSHRSSRLRVGQKLPTIILPPDSVKTDAFTEKGIDLKTGKSTALRVDDRNTEDTIFIRPRQKDARPVLLIFWATWDRASTDDFKAIRTAMRQHPKLRPISISLDHQRNSYLYTLRSDSINFDRRCYFRIWDTPVVSQLAITAIPYYILADSARTVRALGSDWKRDIQPAIDQLK